MARPVQASIDIDAIKHNLAQVKRLAPDSKIMAIVKADAYGHKLSICADALSSADGFGLLDLTDAISLRQSGFTQLICLLEGFFTHNELLDIAEYNLEPVIHSHHQVAMLESVSNNIELNLWLKVDTGMNRLGFEVEEFQVVYEKLSALNCIKDIKLMSHLANADDNKSSKTERQLADFLSLNQTKAVTRSLANSAAVLKHPECHLDWVRPGIMLYGSSPFSDHTADNLNLKPVMTFSSEIISVKQCKQGNTVGYSGLWVCPNDMRIGIVACGYGDGYPRHAPTGTPVMVAGNVTQLIGRVSMDMLAVDLRGIGEVKVGSPVELWGNNIAIDDVAEMSGTISYELLCSVTERVKRQGVEYGEG